MSKQPDGGKALLFEQTGTPFPVLTNMMGSDRRMAMALGVESLDELTRRLDDLLQQAVTPKNSLLDKLRMLPLLAEMSRWLPRTSSSRGECQQVVAAGGGGVARCAAGAQVLAVRRRTLRDAAAGAYPRSRNGNPQRGHVPAATVRRPHDGHALAPAQDRSPSLRRLQACRAADARVGSVGRRSGLYVCCDGSDAGQHGRIPAGGFLRRRPVKLVKCITNDIYVPADCDFVIEGYVDPSEPKTVEGPFGDIRVFTR